MTLTFFSSWKRLLCSCGHGGQGAGLVLKNQNLEEAYCTVQRLNFQSKGVLAIPEPALVASRRSTPSFSCWRQYCKKSMVAFCSNEFTLMYETVFLSLNGGLLPSPAAKGRRVNQHGVTLWHCKERGGAHDPEEGAPQFLWTPTMKCTANLRSLPDLVCR